MTITARQLVTWFFLACFYVLAAKIGLSLAFEQANTSPVWPPTGIAIAALLYLGGSCWPGIWLGAFLANFMTGLPFSTASLIATGNSFEALVAYWLLVKLASRFPFYSVVSVAKFGLIVCVATTVSATVGVSSLFFGDFIKYENLLLLWTTWWLGDLVGAIVVTPFLIIWAEYHQFKLPSLKLVDFVGFIITLGCVIFIFSHWFSAGREHYPMAFVFFPIAIWLGYRFSQYGATLFIVLISGLAIYATLNGLGPFVRNSQNESLLLLQCFMGVLTLASLTVVASMDESKSANLKLAENQIKLNHLIERQSSDLEIAADEIKLAESVFNETLESIMITDKDALILRVNPAFSRTTGYTSSEVIGKNPKILKSGYHNSRYYQAFWQSLNKEKCWQGEVWDKRKNGEIFPAQLTVIAVVNKQGDIFQYIGIFTDLSEKKLTDEKIYQLAHFDPVSGLQNRISFRTQLEQAIAHAERQGSQMALLYLDLDNFKLINDATGHPIGDCLLKEVAERIRSTVRQEDSVANLGGDEFVILVMDIHSCQDASLVARKILDNISQPIFLQDNEVVVTASIGISSYPLDGKDADTLLMNADAAMHIAKRNGRNMIEFFTSEMGVKAQDQLLLENDMRKALENDEFILHYQPQVNVGDEKVIGCEALIRWQHPTRGLLSPADFIYIAEESGIIRELGQGVLREACLQQVRWKNQGLIELRMAINISSRQFFSQDLVTQVAEVMQSTGINSSNLELELTESTIMENVEENIRVLQQLHQMGVQLAVDDFGTGYSSMAYLKRFPIDKLKIDRSFVNDIATDPDDAAIVKATTTLGHSLHINVIAEGVETKAQLDFLKSIDCDEIQGYYYSKPLAVIEFEKFINGLI